MKADFRFAVLTLFYALVVAVSPAHGRTGYRSIAVGQPAAESTVFDNNGRVKVVVVLTPPLQASDRVELLLDGAQAAEQAGTAFRLSGVERGSHTLQARVVGGDGRTLISSAPVTFSLFHASRLFPNRHPAR